MQFLSDGSALRAVCDDARARGARVGLIPTMGALHAGHLALVDRAAAVGATFRVVTIFVNPLQFGEGEDLERYPRTLEADLAACRERGIDAVFVPAPDEMYPPGFQTHVEVSSITNGLEGQHRPGHFRGVTTVVAKLFLLAGPCVAVFGRKDYQQLQTIRRMVYDLGFPIEVVGHPIVREPDGLALSSRNRYLSPEERSRALGIARGLRAADEAWAAGIRDADTLRRITRSPIADTFDRIDYVEVVDPETLEPCRGNVVRASVVVAAHVGSTRLIDNLELGIDPVPGSADTSHLDNDHARR